MKYLVKRILFACSLFLLTAFLLSCGKKQNNEGGVSSKTIVKTSVESGSAETDSESEAERTATDEESEKLLESGSAETDSKSGAELSATDDDSEKLLKTIKEGDVPSIVCCGAEAAPGELTEIDIELVNNPGILGMTMMIAYDEEKLVLDSVEEGDAFSGILTFTEPGELKSGGCFVWDGVEIAKDDIRDGTLLHLSFKMADDIDKGKYPITIYLTEDGTFDNNLETIGLQIIPGYITII